MCFACQNLSSASSGRHVFRPRSMGPLDGPKVDFPPSFPNAFNLKDICQFSKAPVRYQMDTFPSSGFGYAVRQAEAVNQLQSWYSVCCGINGSQEEKICCAEQAVRVSTLFYLLMFPVAVNKGTETIRVL